MILLYLIATPLIAAALCLAAYKKLFLAEIVSMAAAVIEASLGVYLINQVVGNGSHAFTEYAKLDSLGAFFLLTVLMVRVFATAYSVGYIRKEMDKQVIGFKRVQQYYVLLNLFVAALYGALMANNPVLMWIAIEATTLITVFLVSIYHHPLATEAAWKYLVLNSLGLLLAFFGTFIFLGVTGSNLQSGSWANMLASVRNADPLALQIAFAFVFIGYGTKVGLFPMHTWRPDAYNKAPLPIVALLSSALLNIALFAILRFKIVTDSALGPEFTQNLFLVFGTVSVVFSVIVLLTIKSYKRMLAYSTIEHAGLIIVGFGFGGFAVYAGLLHILYHSFVKSFLFLVSGNIFVTYGRSQIANIRGLRKALPVSSVLFLLGLLAISGFPLFGIFLSEFYMLAYGMVVHPYVAFTIAVSLVFAFVAFFRHASRMAFGEPPLDIPTGEMPPRMVVPLVVYLGVIIAVGWYLPAPVQMLLINAFSLFTI